MWEDLDDQSVQISLGNGRNTLRGGSVMVFRSTLGWITYYCNLHIHGLRQKLQEKIFQLRHKSTFQISYAVLLHIVSRVPLAARHKQGIQ